jgi:hypothetical protein
VSLTKTRDRMTSGTPLNILDFGARLDGVTDDTAFWNAALATGRDIYFPQGASVITGRLNFSATEGQSIRGAGRLKSQFLVSYTSFNMATDAVIKLGYVNQELCHFGIVFNQPSTAVRASIKTYPAAVNLNGWARATLHNLLIQAAWIGIYGQGNCGGAHIDDIQSSSFHQGLYLDNALDSCRISRFHHWPFGVAGDTNLMLVWQDNNNVGLDIGRVDDIHITDCLVFSSRVRFLDYGNGAPSGHVNNLSLDTKYSTIEMTAGKITMSNVNAGSNVTDHAIIILYGGELKIAGLAMENGGEHLPMVSVVGGTFICSNILVTSYGGNSTVFSQTGGKMILSNGLIEAGGTTRTAPMIDIAAGRATVIGMKTSDAGAATGNFISVTTDDYHVITGNQALGYSLNIPTNKVNGIYEPNGTVTGGMQGSAFLSSPHWTRFTGTLDVSGNGTITHGLTDPRTKVLSLTASYDNGIGAQVLFAPTSISATQIALAAGVGGASKAYTCWLCSR